MSFLHNEQKGVTLGSLSGNAVLFSFTRVAGVRELLLPDFWVMEVAEHFDVA